MMPPHDTALLTRRADRHAVPTDQDRAAHLIGKEIRKAWIDRILQLAATPVDALVGRHPRTAATGRNR